MSLPLALGLARGLHMAGTFAVFGTILLSAFFVPPGAPPALRRALRRLGWGSLLVALSTGCAWFLLQSADMASASSLSDVVAALPIVIESTLFGHLLTLRVILLIVAVLCMQTGFVRIAAFFAGLAVIAEAWLGHGGAMTGNVGSVLLISSILHLAGGAAWIGSLPALFLMISGLPQVEAARLARRYSPFAIACVAGLLASATVQFIFLIGSFSALFTSLYGRVALVKILLLGGLILLAAMNRFRRTPALFDMAQPGSKTKILSSIGLEIALGLMALLAAGWLINLTPPTMAAMLKLQQ